MKHILILFLLVFFTLSTKAQFNDQDLLICIRDNVNVRKGPGKNYPLNKYFSYGSPDIYVLHEGDVVRYYGKEKNGYIKIYNCLDGHNIESFGWAYKSFFKLACDKCQKLGFIEIMDAPNCFVCGRRTFNHVDEDDNSMHDNGLSSNNSNNTYKNEISNIDSEINDYIDKVNSASGTFLDAIYYGGYSRYSPPGSYFTLIEYCNDLEKLVYKAKKMRHDHGDYTKDTEYNGILNKVYTIKSDSGKMLNRLY